MIHDDQTFIPAPRPFNDIPRLKELHDLDLIENGREQRFDRYTQLASDLLGQPVALITLIDDDFQWFKSCYGVDMEGTPRDISFCSFAMLEEQTLVIEDMTKDSRLMHNPLVTNDPKVRFYAGTLLRGPNNHIIGTLCVLGFEPSTVSEQNLNRLVMLGKMVEHELLYHHHLTNLRKQVENTILYDSRTDMPSRRLFMERLDKTLELRQKSSDDETKLIVGCLTIPVMESIKLAKGDEAAHKLVKDIGYRLSQLGHHQIFFGLSFANQILVYSEVAPDHEANLIESLLSICEIPYIIQDQAVLVNMRMGLIASDDNLGESYDLIEKAVIAAQLAQKSDKTVMHYSECPVDQITAAYDLEHRLAQAIKQDELFLVFQPIIDIPTGAIVGAEALCRWIDPNLGPVSPAEFIPIAEETGLIYPLGELVVRKAVESIGYLQKNCGLDFPISVNISGGQLLKNDFLSFINSYIEKGEISAKCINFEVTESSLIYDMERATHNMAKARKQGFTFSLDDFGTGFSSLQYLQKLPVSYVKIDKSFIYAISKSTRDREFLKGIVSLAKSLKLSVVVEGVETAEQLAVLKELSCDRAQGYFFSKPLVIDDFTDVLVAQKKQQKA